MQFTVHSKDSCVNEIFHKTTRIAVELLFYHPTVKKILF